jgi:TolB protein
MFRFIGLACLLSLGSLLGCGGGGGGGTGGPTGFVTIQVDWPPRIPDSVPTYANSIVARITVASTTYTLTINRSGDNGYTANSSFSQGIPVGTQPMTVTAYTQTNGQGSAVATAALNISVVEGQTTTQNVSANLQTTVDHVEIDNQPLFAFNGVPMQLAGHAENAAGQTLLLPSSALTWSMVSGAGTVTPAGLFTGLANGTATVRLTESESGQTVDADITVSTQTVTYQIVCSSDRDAPSKFEFFELYTMRSDGANVVRVTNDLANAHHPCFNHDGSKIVFTSNKDADFPNDFTEEIYSIAAGGGASTRLTNNSADDGYASFSKDGTKIVFGSMRDGNWEIYKMNSNGTSQTRLTSNDDEDIEPRWNQNASKIVFTSDRTGNKQIHTMNADGTGQTNVSSNGFNDFSASFSPDGTKIVFVSDRDGQEEIYIMNADGSAQQRLTNHGAFEASPVFTQDGQKIVFVTSRDGNEELYIMNLDGSGATRITNNNRSDQAPGVRLSP